MLLRGRVTSATVNAAKRHIGFAATAPVARPPEPAWSFLF